MLFSVVSAFAVVETQDNFVSDDIEASYSYLNSKNGYYVVMLEESRDV